MRRCKKAFLASLMLLGLAISLATSSLGANAQTGWELLLIPNKKEYFANAGDQIRGVLTVRNDSDQALSNIVPFAKNFTAGDQETGDPKILDVTEEGYRYELAAWMQFSQEPITVEAHNSVDIEYVIDVPSDAEPGGHYAILYLYQVNPGEGQTAMGVLTQIGSLILVTVSGDVQVQGDILEFYTGKKLYEYLPVDFYLRMQNTGNVHYRPAGTIFVDDWREKNVGVVDVNEQRGVVMPESIRKYQTYWSDGFLTEEFIRDEAGNVQKDEQGEKVKELKVNWKQWNLFRIGKYTAKAIIVYDDENGEEQRSEAVTSFWVIPWKLILAIIIGIFVGAWGLRRLNKWYNKRLIEKYEDQRRTEEEKRRIEQAKWHKKRKKVKEKRISKKQKIREAVKKWFGNFGEKKNGDRNGDKLTWQDKD